MTLRHAVLGLLSWQPFSGYDLKKIFADSAALYWSGNNNQVYTTLLELQREGLVACEVLQQESLPAKKIYTLTPAGLAELRAWLETLPPLPELRSPFLVQLGWADLLPPAALDDLLDRYAGEVEAQVLILREKQRRGGHTPARTPRETLLWAHIDARLVAVYADELAWVRALRARLTDPTTPSEE